MHHPDKETRIKFYESFNKNEDTVNSDIATIKAWMQTQTHHPEVMDDAKIRNMLHLCKFDTEKAKERVDNYYTFRIKHSSFFKISNPKLDSLQECMETNYLCYHPKPLGVHRVCFLKPREKNTFRPASAIKLCFCILEIRLQEDFMVDDVFVIDMSTFSFRDLCKLSPALLISTLKVYRNIFSMRLNALYLINSPSYITVWMTLFRLVLPAKIFGRFQVHKGSEVLEKLLSNDDLPKDYGGNGPSLEKLTDLTKKKLAEYEERFDLLDTFTINENLRM